MKENNILQEEAFTSRIGKVNLSHQKSDSMSQQYILRGLEYMIIGLVSKYRDGNNKSSKMYFDKSIKFLNRAIQDISKLKNAIKDD